MCSGAVGAGGVEDLLQKVTSEDQGEGQTSQREEGRARVCMAQSENCESFGVAGFRRHIRAVTLEK